MKFIKYYFAQVINWTWTLSTLFFTFMLLHSSQQTSILALISLIPAILLIFNITTEYNTYSNYALKVTNKALTYLAFGLCFIILIISILIYDC